MAGNKSNSKDEKPIFITEKQLAARWICSISSAARYAKKSKFRILILGDGRNGGKKYFLEDVENLEQKQTVK
jgi:hypothetical protein